MSEDWTDLVPLEAGAQLYEITVKVRPQPGHPRFFDFQFGFLRLWLFANSTDDATMRAKQILDALPYEQIGNQARIGYELLPLAKGSDSPYEGARREAEQIGLAIQLTACETGADGEAEFEAFQFT